MNWLMMGLPLFALFTWLAPLVETTVRRWRPRSLADQSAESHIPLPSLSVVVPACNEEQTIAPAMRSLLACDYPGLEIIAVNDRSTDRTGEILDEIAASNPRLRVLHIQDLPAGWLGKNHALQVGSDQCAGSFILFTDADVVFEPTALRRAVLLCEREEVDHLVVMPDVVLKSFWETVAVWMFGVVFVMHTRPWRLEDPKSNSFCGVGAFNLVRASAYRAMGGHHRLRMDVADDMKLGKCLKESGAYCKFLVHGGLVSVRWVEGAWGLVTGLTKNFYGGFGFRPERAVLGVVGISALGIWPPIGLFVGPTLPRVLCGLTMVAMVAAATVARPNPKSSPLHGLAFPFGSALIVFTILRSVWFTHRQGGIKWRGTFYALQELRKGIV